MNRFMENPCTWIRPFGGCSWNYDKLHDIVNNHRMIRQMLRHVSFSDDSDLILKP